MIFEEYIKDKQAVILGFDNIIYPEKDYLLQVYYLFSEFLSYTEQMDAPKILNYMKQAFEAEGNDSIFEKTAQMFQIPNQYKSNFELLHQNARLPLKLLLYKNVLALLQELEQQKKKIFLLIDGDPIMQINKIKQTEWHGLEHNLNLYFTTEFAPKPNIESFTVMAKMHNLLAENILVIGNSDLDEQYSAQIGAQYLSVKKLLL